MAPVLAEGEPMKHERGPLTDGPTAARSAKGARSGSAFTQYKRDMVGEWWTLVAYALLILAALLIG